MEIQLAYRKTGEKQEELIEFLKKIYAILRESGHETYCPILDPNQPTEKKELFQNTFKRLENTDALLVLIRSQNKSEGMLLETSYAITKGKKIIAVIKEGVDTHIRELADSVIEFKYSEEIYKNLK